MQRSEEEKTGITKEVVSIVICYNNAQEVSCYADSLFRLRDSEKAFLVIVINAVCESERAILDSIRTRHKNVVIFDPKSNLGYMNGLLYGYRQYSGTVTETPEYVIMSNTDIEFSDDDFIKDLLNREYSSDVWCIGPSVFTKYTSNYDNPVADSRRTRSEVNSLIRRFSLPFLGGLYVYLSDVKAKYKRSKKTGSRYVYEVHGCFFILTGEFAEVIKGDSYGALMYSEEAYISEMVYHHGKRTYYDSDLEVIHAEHTATKLLGYVKIADHLSKSMKYIRDRFY